MAKAWKCGKWTREYRVNEYKRMVPSQASERVCFTESTFITGYVRPERDEGWVWFVTKPYNQKVAYGFEESQTGAKRAADAAMRQIKKSFAEKSLAGKKRRSR